MKRLSSLLLMLSIASLSISKAQTAKFWTEGFEEAGNETYTTSTDPIPVLTNTWTYSEDNRGRLRLAAGNNFYHTGSNAATLDTERDNNQTINYLTALVDISAFPDLKEFYLSFAFTHHGEEDNPNDRVWVRTGNDDSQTWVEVYDINANMGSASNWISVEGLDLLSALSSQLPASYLQIRFGQEDNYRATSTTRNDGITYDDIELVATNIEAPSNFTASNLTSNSVDLTWNLNTLSEPVIITMASSELSGMPTIGTEYNLNDDIGDGSTIVYKGSLENHTQSGITPGTTTYFRIWSYNATTFEYSLQRSVEVKSLSSATIFYEDFENGNAQSWTLGGPSRGNEWVIGNAESYLGVGSAYISNDGGATAAYNHDVTNNVTIYLEKRVAIPSNYKSAELVFYWKGIAEDGYDGGSVRENRNTQLIPNIELANQATWVERAVDITAYIGTNFDLGYRWYNDRRSGQDPAFCIDEVRIIGSEVARPQSFSGSSNSATEVDLTWQKSVDNDNVIIAYSSHGSIGRPESGTTYTVGDYLSGGGEVIYVGSLEAFTHTGQFSGKLNYSIWSVNLGTYSSALTTEVSLPVSLPFNEGFEGDVSAWNFNSGYENAWVRGKALANTGTQSAYISGDNGITAGYDINYSSDTYMELKVDLRGFTSAQMTFEWMLNGNNSAFGELYVDGNRVSNSEEYKNSSTWNTETYNFANGYLNDIVTVGFRWRNYTGGTAENPGFCVDDVHITGTIEDPASFSATNPNDLLNNLSWTKNSYDDDVLVVWSSDGTFGIPVEGVSYDEGDVLPGGGTVLYRGDLLLIDHSPLNYSTIYYYKAFSSRNGIYSSGIESNANTPAKVPVLSEDWEDNADGYPEWSTNNTGNNNWLLGGTNVFAGGNRSTYVRDGASTVADYDEDSESESWIEVNIDLTDLQSASLSFDWQCEGEIWSGTVYDYGEVYINTGGGDQRISDPKEFYGSNAWTNKVIDLSSHTGSMATLKFAWFNDDNTSDGPLAFCIDNIEVGGIYAATSQIADGTDTEPSTISSIANSQANSVQVMDVLITDNTSLYNDVTRLQQLVISKGASNTIDNWTEAIAGALLFGPDLNVAGLAGSITSSTITFTGTDIITIANLASETYQLKIWLNTDLIGLVEGDSFDFEIKSNDIVTGLGDDFIKNQTVSSGAIAIDVIATELTYDQQPSAYATVDVALANVPVVAASDVNGNIDTDYSGIVSITNSVSIVMNPGASTTVNSTATNGLATFTNLSFTSSNIVTLTATATGLTNIESEEVNIGLYCPSAHTSNGNRYLTNVIVNTVNNTSGDDAGYGDYLSQSSEMIVNESYDIDLGAYNAGGRAYAYVWIDWNGDGDFEDTNEKIDLGNTTSTGVIVFNGSITVPASASNGATRMRVQITDQNNPATPCGAGTGEIEDYTINIATEGWLGASNVWNVPQNWSTGVVPDNSTDIFIPEHPYHGDVFPVITSTNVEMKNLEIANNASLTIKPGATVRINSDATLNGDLIVENTDSKPSSLIVEGNVIGDVTLNWNYELNRYWYVGHSISNAKMSSYDATGSYNVYGYSGGWNNLTGGSLDTDPLTGYAIGLKGTIQDVRHKGTLNNTDLSKTLIAGMQLIANPYPSYYKLVAEDPSTGDFRNTTGSVYVRTGSDPANRTLATFNVTTGISTPSDTFDGTIAPGQCFWVSRQTAGDVYMKISKRVHGTASLKSGKIEKDILRLHLQNQYAVAEAVIAINDNGQEDISRLDSKIRMESGNKLSYIYSLKSDANTVINVLPSSIIKYEVAL
ncbi:GEVED domain-containing protein, partial [Carboxylicivirga sp. N1Y90]|uniref:GEVED domain-containing protein n=1 Tax=Carboxylicivirga fragile TaxID=3417571 RepID=UPI003D32C427|nr:hypothetical protein [Marinilabiliaceae bacterium N1Y90]